jgi:hypothetical protein
MKEKYSHEFNKWERFLQEYFGLERINSSSFDFKWGYFAPRPGFELIYHRGGYFDSQCSCVFCLGWGVFHIKLPWKTKLTEGCNLPRYGIAIHNDTFWIYKGGDYDESLGQVTRNEYITWDLRFFNYIFDGCKVKDVNNQWVEYDSSGNDNRKIYKYPFSYALQNGTIQDREIEVYVERQKWHRRWFPVLTTVQTTLNITFNKETGHDVGSYKGGVTGTGIEMKPNETIEDTIKRFKVERKL